VTRTKEISKIRFAYFKGKVKLKLRGEKLDEISNIARDIYHLDIYESEISKTEPISRQEYNAFENTEEKLSPTLIEALVEKPGKRAEKHFYIEDIRNCIIHTYNYESFKRDRTCFAVVKGEIVFKIEYRVKEKVQIDVPFDEEFTINAGKIKIKRAAVANTPKESGEKLVLAGIIAGILEFVALLALTLTFIFAFRDYWQTILLLASILGSMWLISYFGKFLLRIIGTVISWLILLLVLGFLFTWVALSDNNTETTANEENYEDITENDSIIYEEKDSLDIDSQLVDSMSINSIYNSLHWSNYNGQHYSYNYSIDSAKFQKARHHRSSFTGYSWGNIYYNLYKYDSGFLKNIYQKYDSLRTGKNPLEFARLIVSSIQEVPYTWILPESCLGAANKQEINNSGYACLGNVKKYGIQSPLEFMINQKGDCDTKALVVYSILKHFNYDVRMLISEAFEHALLGINIPANGKFKLHLGKKYYVWETTVKGLDIGQLAPQHSNMNLWEVAL
jgi:energy-coupling factor transporter transmembrane protein EcfT